jgi:GLPGLI family protein
MRKMVPEFNISKAELFFSGEESLFRGIKEEEDIRDQAGQEEGVHVNFKFGGDGAENYRNYATSRGAEQRELGPKKYIIDDSLFDFHWKLESDTLTVRGYLCHKATGKDSRGNPVVAWYAENIHSPAGPEAFGGLPGLILLANSNDGEFMLTAVEIKTSGIDTRIVKAPTEGKRVSRTAFKKLMEDEMGPDAGSGRPVIRIIRQ